MLSPSHLPSILLSLLLFTSSVQCSSTAQTCQIANCAECKMDDTNSTLICTKCEDSYIINNQQILCFLPEESSNTDMIVSICIGSVVLLGIGWCIWSKCRSHQAKEEAKQSNDLTAAPASAFSPVFSPSGMGMTFGDPLECMQFNSGTTSNYCSIYNQQQKECAALYDNRFNQKRSVDSPFKNDCDRFAFKLDRKQNMFPTWADKIFERYTPTNPSKRSKHFSARFSETFECIPENILEQSAEALAALLASPVLEPIPLFEKQNSKSSCSDQEDTTSKSTNATTSIATLAFKINEPINNESSPATTTTISEALNKFTAENSLKQQESPIPQTIPSPKLLYAISDENFLPRNRSESNSDLIPKFNLNHSTNQSQTLSLPSAAPFQAGEWNTNPHPDPTKNSTLNVPTISIYASISETSQLNDCRNSMNNSSQITMTYSNFSNLIFKADKVKVPPHVTIPMPTDPTSENELDA